MERNILREQLGTVNRSLFYLMLIILSVLLSFWSVLIQREQLEKALAGNSQKTAAQDVLPIKLIASVLTVNSLGFFFALALRTCRDAARGNDPAAQRSAGMNVWASLFVLTAALIRLCDISFTGCAAADERRHVEETAESGRQNRINEKGGRTV